MAWLSTALPFRMKAVSGSRLAVSTSVSMLEAAEGAERKVAAAVVPGRRDVRLHYSLQSGIARRGLTL